MEEGAAGGQVEAQVPVLLRMDRLLVRASPKSSTSCSSWSQVGTQPGARHRVPLPPRPHGRPPSPGRHHHPGQRIFFAGATQVLFFLDFYGNAKFLKTFLCCIDCVGPCPADVTTTLLEVMVTKYRRELYKSVLLN